MIIIPSHNFISFLQAVEEVKQGKYTSLYSIIKFPSEFSFADYYNGEQDLLKPLLEELGCYNINFIMGEKDSFGPLTRVCVFVMPDASRYVRAVYG